MAETDSPLKRLVRFCIKDFAEWLIGTEVRHAHTLNIELTTEPTAVDQLFNVVLMDGRTMMLHIEFQGRSSRSPMRWRMLDYMSRLADIERNLDLCSVVFYVGQGVGAKDSGEHYVAGPDGTKSLSWKYKVIRLWEIQSQDLLALKRPGLLPLLGLTQLSEPEETVPRVIDYLKEVSDGELQGRLFTSLMALLDDEEVITMIEKIVEADELLIDSPYLRRIKEEGREEGRKEGHEEGREEGREEGELSTLRRNTLNGIVWRFDPPSSVYQKIEHALSSLDSVAMLDDLFEQIFQVGNIEEFRTALDSKVAAEAKDKASQTPKDDSE